MRVGDVVAPGASEALLDAMDEAFGGTDAVFANAGYGIEKPVLDASPTEIRRIFDVNLVAADRPDAGDGPEAPRGQAGPATCSGARASSGSSRCLTTGCIPPPRRPSPMSADPCDANCTMTASRSRAFTRSPRGPSSSTSRRRRAAKVTGRWSRTVFRPTCHGCSCSRRTWWREAVVKCLQRPRAEVWTSPDRTIFGRSLRDASPGLRAGAPFRDAAETS